MVTNKADAGTAPLGLRIFAGATDAKSFGQATMDMARFSRFQVRASDPPTWCAKDVVGKHDHLSDQGAATRRKTLLLLWWIDGG